MRPALSAALCAFLAGCGAVGQGTPAAVCPRPTEWTAGDVAAFVAAERELPDASPIWAELGELTRLRAEARACRAAPR